MHRKRGTALVETAMTMILLFMILFGVMEGCRMLMIQHALTDAAREAARYAVLPLTQTSNLANDTQVIAKAHEYLDAAGLSVANVSVDRSAGLCPAPTACIKVHTDLPYQIVSLSMLSVLNITLKAESMMRNETSSE